MEEIKLEKVDMSLLVASKYCNVGVVMWVWLQNGIFCKFEGEMSLGDNKPKTQG